MSSPWIARASWRLLIFLVAGAGLNGINQTASATGMALPQAIDNAVQNNKDLQAARYAVESARAVGSLNS